MPHPLLFRFYLFILVLLVLMLALAGRRGETRTRSLTLIALLHLVVLALWIGPVTWTVLVGGIAALAAWELSSGPDRSAGTPAPAPASARAALVALALATGAIVLLLHIPILWVAATAWLLAASTLFLPAAAVRHPAFSALLAVGQIGPCAAALALLGWAQPPAALVALILLVQLNDAFAYLAGRRLGRTRLFPVTSPNKSLEGYAAGAVAMILALLVLHSLVPALPPNHALARGAVTLLVALFAADAGDLAYSALKRRRGVKDSGRLLPGHGGALDRFGNLLLAAPLFAVLWAAGIQ